MKDELLSRASELIAQRTAEIMGKGTGSRVTRQGSSITIDGSGARRSKVVDEWAYAGQLQVGSRVMIVPFGFYPYFQDLLTTPEESLESFQEASINGRSLYSKSRPSLPRLASGGAVFFEKTWELYLHPKYGITAEFKSADIIQQSITANYPRHHGTVRIPFGSGEVSIPTPVSKSYTLIGVYNADGETYPGDMPNMRRVSSFTDPFDGGTYPVSLGSSMKADYNVEYFYADDPPT